MYSVFVINLDKDTERMRFMHEQLSKLGIKYTRQTAVLGSQYKPTLAEYDEIEALKKGGHALRPNELGCALSHARVLEKIVTEQIPYALVLEDDVVLPPNFTEVLEKEVEKNISRNHWDYLLFDYTPVGRQFLKMWSKGVKNNFVSLDNASIFFKSLFIFKHFIKAMYVVPLSFYEAIREYFKANNPGPVKFYRPVYFAGAYLITLEGAKKLLPLTKPIVYTADHLPNAARKEVNLLFRAYCPLIVSQDRYTYGSSILELSGEQVKDLYSDLHLKK